MYNSDSDDEFNYDLSGNHMAGNTSAAQARDVSGYKAQPVMEDLDYNDNDFKAPKESDLKVEDNWDFDMPDPGNSKPTKTLSKRQELLEAQKNKLAKKKTVVSGESSQPTSGIQYKKKTNAPTLDDMYNNEMESKIKKYDQELEGEIQHESLKKRLEEQRQNARVEFVAEDPAKLLRKTHTDKVENENLGRLERVDMEEAKVERGYYDDEAKGKRKKKKRKTIAADENGHPIDDVVEGDEYEDIAGTAMDNQQRIPAVQKRKHEELQEHEDETDPSTQFYDQEEETESTKVKKKKKSKKKSQEELELEEDKVDEPEYTRSQPPPDAENIHEIAPVAFAENDEGAMRPAKERLSKKEKQEAKNKRKEEILKIKNEFMEKLISPFTEVDELVKMFMRPLPKEVGILECTIVRNKSGFNFWNPKYTLVLSDGERFLLNGKKRGGNKTSNYMVTLDQDGLKKKGKGFLGKVRANFMGTEFTIYDQGENPKKTKDVNQIRREMAAVLYESNVLGSKGPRKMRVLIPAIDKEDNI